jgi:hypothetical protein
MSDQHTPTIAMMRARYENSEGPFSGADFDRGLAEHDRQEREKAEAPLRGIIAEAKAAIDADYGLRESANRAWHILDRANQATNGQDTAHDAYSSPDAAFDEMYDAEITAHRAEVAARTSGDES